MKVTVRDATVEDVKAQDDYFENSSEAYLRSIGIDVEVYNNLPPTDFDRIRKLIATPVEERSAFILAAEVDGKAFGIVSIIFNPDGKSAIAHAHIFNIENRRRGLGAKVFDQILAAVFDRRAIDVIIGEPNADNLALNGLLQKMGLRPVATYEKEPEGFTMKRIVNRYEVTRGFYERRKQMAKEHLQAPEHTAVRVSLWRALHAELDEKPLVFEDTLGPTIVNEPNWRERRDMDPGFSKSMRASIVGRARFVEDQLEACLANGVSQYVILGAGLDTFAQRRPELAANLQIFEVDQSGPQAWKKRRLIEEGLAQPPTLHFVPIDFESDQSWLSEIKRNGFDASKPAFVVSTGVSMYLSREANQKLLSEVATLATGSRFAMTFMLALELLPSEERKLMEFAMAKAAESATPFISFFKPEEILKVAKTAGFQAAEYVSAQKIFDLYFAKRNDGLNAGTAECFLLAKT